MGPELRRQVEAYAEYLDEAAPSLEDISTRSQRMRPGRRPGFRRSRFATAAAAAVGGAAIVLAAIGVAGLFRTAGQGVAQSTTTTSTTTSLAVTSPLQFEIHPAGTLFRGDQGGPHPFTGPGGIVVVGDEIHMFRNEYGDEGGVVRHGISTNGGISFVEDPSPVLALDGDDCCSMEFRVRSAAISPAGEWTLYLDPSHSGDAPSLMRATAANPSGPFSLDPIPVLEPGAAGTWDESAVSSPAVVTVADGMVMFYVGKSADGVERIGRAVSSDGGTWTKDPEPVFESALEWEAGSLTRVDAALVGDRWVLVYAGSSTARRGIAVSDDGATFTRLARTVVLSAADLPRPQIRDAELIFTPGGPLLYLENGGARTSSDVILLEGVGDLGR